MEKKKLKTLRAAVVLAPFFILLAVYAFKDFLLSIFRLFSECLFHRMGLLCPGCGNTRSFFALLNFDIAESIMYNPDLIILCILFILLWAECAAYLIGREIKLLPRSKWFYIVLLTIFAVYCVLRNIPALHFISLA